MVLSRNELIHLRSIALKEAVNLMANRVIGDNEVLEVASSFFDWLTLYGYPENYYYTTGADPMTIFKRLTKKLIVT